MSLAKDLWLQRATGLFKPWAWNKTDSERKEVSSGLFYSWTDLRHAQAYPGFQQLGQETKTPCKNFSLQKEEQSHLGIRAMLWRACHKARRGGFGMKMVFTHSTWRLSKAKFVVTRVSWSRNSSTAFPLCMNNEGKLCLFWRISENSKLHTRSQPYYVFGEVIWKLMFRNKI